jgi:hypothetical protein
LFSMFWITGEDIASFEKIFLLFLLKCCLGYSRV